MKEAANVAPLVGAWIEIAVMVQMSNEIESLPSWERGLKFLLRIRKKCLLKSLPSWERGLK